MRRVVCTIENVVEKVNPGQFYSTAAVASVEGGVKGLFVVEKTRHRKKSCEMANVLVVVNLIGVPHLPIEVVFLVMNGADHIDHIVVKEIEPGLLVAC